MRASNDCLERPNFFDSLQSLNQFANILKNSIFPSLAVSALPIHPDEISLWHLLPTTNCELSLENMKFMYLPENIGE